MIGSPPLHSAREVRDFITKKFGRTAAPGEKFRDAGARLASTLSAFSTEDQLRQLSRDLGCELDRYIDGAQEAESSP